MNKAGSTDEKKRYISSIEDGSIIHKFDAIFFVASILPLITLFYFYAQFVLTGNIQITELRFKLTLMFVALGMLLGYATIRTMLKQIISLSKANRHVLENLLDSKKILELGSEKNEIAILAKSFDAITERLEENVKSLELAKKTLHTVMTKVGQGIASMDNIDTLLELILETVTDALEAKTGVLLLIDDGKSTLRIKMIYGMQYLDSEHFHIDLKNEKSLAEAIKNNNSEGISGEILRIAKDNGHSKLFSTPILCAPMVIREKVKGIISVSLKDENAQLAGDEYSLLRNLAAQTAVAIENSKLNTDLEKTYFETITALALAVDAKDRYSRGHLMRVSEYCVLIADKLGLDDADKKMLRDGAMLHDIGKIGIPDEVLNKKGPLNDQEWVLMRKHTEIGESIIKPIRSLRHLCDIIRHHHEKLDGSGYPDGISNDDVTPLVRILTVADIYDALTTSRPYREKMTQKQAFDVLRNLIRELDQEIVGIFIEAVTSLKPLP